MNVAIGACAMLLVQGLLSNLGMGEAKRTRLKTVYLPSRISLYVEQFKDKASLVDEIASQVFPKFSESTMKAVADKVNLSERLLNTLLEESATTGILPFPCVLARSVVDGGKVDSQSTLTLHGPALSDDTQTLGHTSIKDEPGDGPNEFHGHGGDKGY